MTDLIDTVQDASLDDAYIELFDIDLRWYDSNGALQTDTIHLIDGLDPENLNLWMPYDNSGTLEWAEYIACPIGIEGISAASTGALARPVLSIANIVSLTRTISNYDEIGDGLADESNFSSGGSYNGDANTILKELNISNNEDILGSMVTYRKTLLKNTYVYDSTNNVYYAYGDRSTTISPAPVPFPKEFPTAKFVLDRVAVEDSILVQFELASPFDVQGVKIPNRYVIGRFCPWEYTGGLTSGSVKSGCIWDNSSGPWYDVDNNSVATKDKDVCGKTIQACKVRFHGGATATSPIPLPFGGFPGSRKFK